MIIWWIFSELCTMGWENFSNLWCSDYWKMHLWVKKLNLNTFAHALLAKLSPRKRETTGSPQVAFFLKMYRVREISQLYIDNLIRFWGLAYGKVFCTNIDVQGISGLILYSFLLTFRWLAGAWARQVLPYRFKFIMECSVVSFIEKYVTII